MVEIGFIGTVIIMVAGWFLGTYIIPKVYKIIKGTIEGEKK